MWEIIERPDLKHATSYVFSYHMLWQAMLEFIRAMDLQHFTVVRNSDMWYVVNHDDTIVWKAQEQ